MAKALHIRFRRKARDLAHKTLSKLFPVEKNPEPMALESIQRILVVRINYRIGNILFTTPLLNALAQKFPHAQIDMMIGAPFVTPLVEEMPQIHKVYSFPRALLKKPLEVLKLKKTLQNNHYDLLIAPNLSSSSDSLFSFLVSSRYKVGFYAPDVFSPLTHAVELPKDVSHEALKPLELMRAFDSDPKEYAPILDLRLSPSEIEAGAQSMPPKSIGIFRDARGEKKLDDAWWKQLLEALHEENNALHFVDILDPNQPEGLTKSMETLSEKNLRTLASKIANLNAFICADTGPMHLSSASLTPTIALFKTTSPTLYGTLGKEDLSLVIKDKSIQEIAKEIIAHLS